MLININFITGIFVVLVVKESMIFGFNSYICVKKQKLLNKDNPNVSCIYKYIYYTFTDKKKDYQPWF